jgi:PAS domain S-box-containing protein
MRSVELPKSEAERLSALDAYQLLDTPPDSAYDAFSQLARAITGTSSSAISLIDDHRQWLKSRLGIEAQEFPREGTFCSHVVSSGETLVVNDTTRDDRFRENPLVTGDTHVRFYAGVPLMTPEGYTVGTLCVMDERPRELTGEQMSSLRSLGDTLMNVMEGRRRFLSLLDSAHIDIFSVDPDSQKIAFASNGACERFGYDIKMLLGTSIADIIPSMTPDFVCDAFARTRKGEEIVREADVVRRDGSAYPAELRIGVTGERGEPHVLVVALELTQRNEQQREIALLLGAMNVAGDVIMVLTVGESGTLKVSYTNDAFTLQTGYSRDEVIGVDLESIRKASRDDDGIHDIQAALASGQPTQAEVVSTRKDGSIYWNQVSLHPIRNRDGIVTHWISIERDISSDVKRQAALAEEHDRLLALTRAARRLFTSLDAQSIVMTVRGVVDQLLLAQARVLAVNEEGMCVSVERLGEPQWSQAERDSLVDKAVAQRIRVSEDSIGRALAYIGRFGDARYVLELRTRAARPLRSTDLFVFDLIGEYFAVAVRNVSLYHEVEERRSAVLELNQTKSDLIAMLAHDFRGPLTSIVGFADLTSEVGDVNEEQHDFLETIKASALQLSELATDTLTLSRLERNEVVLQLAETDLAELVGAIVAQQKDRRLVELIAQGDAHVAGDEDRLRQVFTNLIDNAIKYTADGPDPVIRIDGGRDEVIVSVRDFGIGIPAGEVSRIFDRFSRASNARKMRIAGTGFGLFLAKQLVHLHGGTIAVESEEGRGSTFTVMLPRRVDRRSAPRTVLLLDRDRDRSFLAYGLQEAGYRVQNASNIEEALGVADALPFDAVVLSAPEVLSNQEAVQFRALSRERSIPLIAIGSGASPRLGAGATLARPVAIGDVVAALERLLGGI